MGEGHGVVRPSVIATARSLAVDGVTAEVVRALRKAGIRPIVLKGPSLALWLYDDGAARYYMDSDVLVPPRDFARAEEVLREIEFTPRLIPVERPSRERPHAEPWFRSVDRAEVDLHVTLFGLGVSPEHAWRAVAGSSDTMTVGGVDVEVLGIPARALLVALHAAQHGPEKPKPLEDLARALDRLPDEAWIEVAALAAELHTSQNLARGLRLLPKGEALADRLGLVDARLAELAAQPGSRAALVVGLDRLAGTAGAGPKLRMIARELFPPPAFMRWWSPLARRSTLALPVAYAWRLVWLLGQIGPSVRAWRQTRASA